MDIEYYNVTNDILKKYVDYFYILKEDQPIEISYLAFPHYNTPICFIKDRAVRFNSNYTIYEYKKGTVAVVGWGMFTEPVNISTTGPLEKIAIVFKPLGLNNFITENFSSVIAKNGNSFLEWDNIPKALFSTNDRNLRIQILETLLIEKYSPFKYQSLLEETISLLKDFEKNLEINEICKTLNLQPRKLHRLFTDHLGTSPSEFRKIIRFRQSVENQNLERGNLTKLALESNYYDQSDFIKTFKSLTQKNPSKFFKQVERHANNNFVLEVLK